jgi:hypothetical protein
MGQLPKYGSSLSRSSRIYQLSFVVLIVGRNVGVLWQVYGWLCRSLSSKQRCINKWLEAMWRESRTRLIRAIAMP